MGHLVSRVFLFNTEALYCLDDGELTIQTDAIQVGNGSLIDSRDFV